MTDDRFPAPPEDPSDSLSALSRDEKLARMNQAMQSLRQIQASQGESADGDPPRTPGQSPESVDSVRKSVSWQDWVESSKQSANSLLDKFVGGAAREETQGPASLDNTNTSTAGNLRETTDHVPAPRQPKPPAEEPISFDQAVVLHKRAPEDGQPKPQPPAAPASEFPSPASDSPSAAGDSKSTASDSATAAREPAEPLAKLHDRESGGDVFRPIAPSTLAEIGISDNEIEALALKYLLYAQSASGRDIARQLRLPFGVLRELLLSLKCQMLLSYRGSAAMSDYEYELTQSGLARAHECNRRCTYFGAAPVSLADYSESVRRQSVRHAKPRMRHLLQAFSDLVLPKELLSQVGQAINAGNGMFLYGPPGNGKTTIAERVMRTVSQEIWIPRTISVTGDIIRVFDPSTRRRCRHRRVRRCR